MHAIRRPLTLAIAATLLAALPAASAPPPGPKTQVYIDVSTHVMAGMPDLGVFGRFASGMAGGREDGAKHWPVSRRIPGSPGKTIDMAMYNALAPGAEAQALVPSGLGAGKSLTLLQPTTPPGRDERTEKPTPDVEVTIHEYWGCSATPRAGQPKTFKLKMKQGQLETQGALGKPLHVPDRDIDGLPPFVLWPNHKNRVRLPLTDGASLAGAHRITGNGVPASLQYEVGANADFLPKLQLQTQGELTDAIALSWPTVDRARAYFIYGMGFRSEREFVIWSSADVAGAGYDLVNYLRGGEVDNWLKQKVLLPAGATACTVPKGIFAGGKPAAGAEPGANGMGTLSMVAYGPETSITWPPRPSDPKAPWNPEWNVRIRTKSTATAMLGIDFAGTMQGADSEERPQQDEEKPKKGLFRNLLKQL